MKNQHSVLGVGLVVLGLTLSGCGSVANKLSSASTSGEVSGTVIVSADDLVQLGVPVVSNSSGLTARMASRGIKTSDYVAIHDAEVMPSANGQIYEVGDDGSVSFTGKTFDVVDGDFSIKGLDPTKTYIARVVKTGTNGAGQSKALVVYAVIVFDADGKVQVTVSEQTSIAADYIIQKVISAGGTGLTSDSAAALESKITEAYASRLSDGDIQRPGTVIDAANLAADTQGVKRDWTLSSSAQDVVEAVDANSDVQKERKTSLIEAKFKQINASQGSIEDAQFIVRQIFGATEGGSSKDGVGNAPPEFFIQQFGEAALKNTTVSIHDFAVALNGSISNQTLKSYWTVDALESQLIEVLTASTSDVRAQYAQYDSPSNSNLEPYLRAVFPNRDRLALSSLSSSQKLSVFQTLYVVKKIGIVDGAGLPEEIQTIMHNSNGPPFDPYKFLKEINFVELQNGRVYLTEMRVIPVPTYKPNLNNSYDLTAAIDANVSLYGSDVSGVARVVLVYPKQGGGTGTVDFTQASNSHGSGHATVIKATSASTAKKGIFSKIASTVMGQIKSFNAKVIAKVNDEPGSGSTQEWRISPWSQNQDTEGTYISDYTSGTATIKVLNSGGETLDSKTVKLYRLNLGTIEWQSPTGMDMAKVESDGWDRDFEPQTFASAEGGVKPVLGWRVPDGATDLPEGTMLAYAVNVGLSVTKLDWNNSMGSYPGINHWDNEGDGYRYKSIWSTWQDGRYITGTSVRIENALASTVESVQNNYSGMYEVNVTPLLVDKKSGAVVWQGKDSRTSFKVGTVAPWTIALRGRVTFGSHIENMTPRDNRGNPVNGTWKIGLFKVGASTNTGWNDLFFKTGHKKPVNDGNGQPLVATLGSMSEVSNSHFADYQLASFTKTDGVLERNSSYRLIVWFDVEETPNSFNWTNSSLDAALDSIELSTSQFLEFFDMGPGDIWVDQRGVRLNTYSNHSWVMLSDSDSNQTVDMTVGSWLN